MKIDLIVIGRMKKGAMYDLCEDYKKRIQWNLKVIECESKFTDPTVAQKDEEQLILSNLKNDAIIVVLDERGNGLRSLDFAKTIENFQNSGESYMQFVIGGSDGLTEAIRDRANLLLSFGQQTWPHMMARMMLLEQVYRAQQILKNHPYHRE
ncbi:MAG: 23S rRNA (pseudouridine(1915)-N(3))-methyltransferase RlmH [Micavibrio sp.]|nr:23S rRNA (pseudouridine(1915)-N(3))-methyltransferase RlmH [Micavibrio sp.]